MPRLSAPVAAVAISGIRAIYERAHARPDVIQLAVGEPSVPVDERIRRAAADAWMRDATHYTPNSGIGPLRAAIRGKLARDNGVAAGDDEIHVTPGAAEALFAAMRIALGAGDEVLVPDPGYPSFTMAARAVGANAVPYPLEASNGFRPEGEVLEQLVSRRTRAILVNSPSNPLGVVWDRASLELVVDFARRHDLWIVSDEVYEYFTWGTPHLSLTALSLARTLGVFSLSKTYALTGARIGYLVAPAAIAERIRPLQEAIVSCVNEPAQWAAVAALALGREPIDAARAKYAASIATATAVLRERGIRFQEPHGTFYLWIDVSHASRGDVMDWCLRLIDEQHVAAAPGSAFGSRGEGWIRICAAGEPAALAEAMRRLPSPVEAGTPAPAAREPASVVEA